MIRKEAMVASEKPGKEKLATGMWVEQVRKEGWAGKCAKTSIRRERKEEMLRRKRRENREHAAGAWVDQV